MDSQASNDVVTFQVQGWNYLSRSLNHTFSSDLPGTGEFLATCIYVRDEQIITADFLNRLKLDHLDTDDAYRPAFLQRIIFTGKQVQTDQLQSDARKTLTGWGTEHFHFIQSTALRTGPYYILRGELRSIWRVYDDRNLAFVQAVWSSAQDHEVYEQVNAAGNEYRGHGITVLPRSYASACQTGERRKLQGLRLAIKDNFHLHGTRTSLGNRAYLETYAPQNTTADAVAKLVAAGAEVIGKTHMSIFAMMEHPTQSVDFQAPFNPRADGYLIPGGSSSGSAVAVAAYDWVDIALCSDTAGSARIPAMHNGVFGFRTSKHYALTQGLLPAWPEMDSIGWLGRDLRIFPRVLGVLHPAGRQANANAKKPKRILYPRDFHPQDSRQTQAMENFLEDVCTVTGCELVSVSISDDWRDHGPADEKDLRQYLYNTTRHGWFFSAYHSFDEFRQTYRTQNGHDPFVTEVVRWYWSLGSAVRVEQNRDLMACLAVFGKWMQSYYKLDNDTMSVFALHMDEVKPKYRDQYPGDDNPDVPGLRPTYLAPILGAPELAIPISQLCYHSRITAKEEQLPLVVGLLGPPGMDEALLNWIIKALEDSGRSTVVKTGKIHYGEKIE